MAIQQLHEAMTATSETHRLLATSMMADEIGDILRMIQVDQQQFAAQGLRDMSGQFTPARRPRTRCASGVSGDDRALLRLRRAPCAHLSASANFLLLVAIRLDASR